MKHDDLLRRAMAYHDAEPDSPCEELAAAIRALREALEPFAKIQPSSAFSDNDNEHYWAVIGTPNRSHFTRQDILRARAALNPPETKHET